MKLETLFKNKSLLKTALTLSHHGKAAPYERLEFLGDRVLGLVIAELMYTTFPHEKEGELARRFTALVREETLAKVALTIGLPEKLHTAEDELRQNSSILSDVCEAILGALYLDQGLDVVKEFIITLWTPYIHTDQSAPKDAKSALQEWAQKHRYSLPVYTIISKTGPDHDPSFTIQSEIKGFGLAMGHGKSKKSAEEAAAKELLKELDKSAK